MIIRIADDGYPVVDKWKAAPKAEAGFLVLIEPSGRGEGSKKYWNCLCRHCNKIVEKRQDRLSAGARGLERNAVRDCGYRQSKCFKKPNIEGNKNSIHKNTTYGGLEIIEETDFIDSNRSAIVLVKCPYCGKIYPTTKRHGKPSKNCNGNHINIETLIQSKKALSKNEEKIAKMLDDIHIPYTTGKTFSTCLDKNLLPFDFYLESPKYGPYVIEYDGEQHFKDIPFFGSFENRRKKDLYKNKFLWKHNIKLIRIPYDKNYTIKDLSIGTTRFLLTPENEKEYYESRSV